MYVLVLWLPAGIILYLARRNAARKPAQLEELNA